MTSRGPGALAAELADRQHGVVSLDQLRAIGLGRGAIFHRLESKRLHTVHRAAAVLWRILRGHPVRIDVTASGRVGRREGIRPHQMTLPADERTVVDGIPVTTVARTLFDLAKTEPRSQLQRAISRPRRSASQTTHPSQLC